MDVLLIRSHFPSTSFTHHHPFLPAKKLQIEGVFGFCNIFNFSDATEILQDRVMVFVNQVAEVIHALVDIYGGNANKNIGDAFLLVWKVSAMPPDMSFDVPVQDIPVSREHRLRRMRM